MPSILVSMANEAQRQERRALKQKLFAIRRFIEGEEVEMTPELKKLKKQYESDPAFTSWSHFPERWDIGDPYSVKKTSFSFDDVDKRNFERAFGKPYSEIVFKEQPKVKKSKKEEVILTPKDKVSKNKEE